MCLCAISRTVWMKNPTVCGTKGCLIKNVSTYCVTKTFTQKNETRPRHQQPDTMRIAPCVTTEILNEYVEILQRETTENFASIMLEVILNNPNTLFINVFYKFNLIIADPDDNKFIDCAIAAQAKYIVTEDHHYDVLRDLEFPKVDIIGLDDAMRMIK